jgi:hypothetical protein
MLSLGTQAPSRETMHVSIAVSGRAVRSPVNRFGEADHRPARQQFDCRRTTFATQLRRAVQNLDELGGGVGALFD